MERKFPDSLIEEDEFSRFDRRDNVFGRVKHDEEAPFFRQGIYSRIDRVLDKEENYSSFELARAIGGWSVYDYFTEAFEPKTPDHSNNIMDKPILTPPSRDPEVLTREVKQAALDYGASLVGVTEVDKRWVYKTDRDGNPVDHLLDYDYAVVMIVPIELAPIRKSPGFPAARASAVSYSKMAFLISCLSEFIRRLGYRAAPMGNDGALSIPLAVDAGLGRLGRNGLLITSELGSCVKICKVFTNMELLEDDPVDTPLLSQCYSCKLCARACEVDAISEKTEPETGRACPSNNEGIFRWPVDHYSCYQFWLENGSDCSSCIAACPFTPN
ncbi:hypothetical protein KGY79_04875 [Candidatus Bipolaricaulota bacterium]|nr:hypothetical protein [Candidatus Bipolaricaulota bacterium]